MSNVKKMKNVEDRLSLLPDSLLHHILSFLNTKCVVQTCVLSKRWKTLWTRIPTLKFDYYTYPPLSVDGESKEKSFKYFIIRVLSQHCSTEIKQLIYYSSDNDGEGVLLEFMICYAGCHNVQQLCINTINVCNWKYCLSTCSSLTVLKIVSRFVDGWGVLSLPSLRILEIECDNWEEQDKDADYYGIRMFSGCPNLESLVLVNYLFKSASISAPKLENFELCASFRSELTFPEVELLTPSLKSVQFSNVLPSVKSDSEFSCIHEVNIELEDCKFERDDSHRQKLTSHFSELLTVFQKASSFILPLKATQVTLSFPFHSKGLSFLNMRHLRLKTDQTSMLLTYLLDCPNLKKYAVLSESNKDRTAWASLY